MTELFDDAAAAAPAVSQNHTDYTQADAVTTVAPALQAINQTMYLRWGAGTSAMDTRWTMMGPTQHVLLVVCTLQKQQLQPGLKAQAHLSSGAWLSVTPSCSSLPLPPKSDIALYEMWQLSFPTFTEPTCSHNKQLNN